jgi:asparagine synthase (glutamine-hydrolysing)
MCGFIGLFVKQGEVPSEELLMPSLERMARRGPDASGIWSDAACSLGHRRLAILDLDGRAEQPMHSTCGRYVIVFNGEIYNFDELRSDMVAMGVQFRTNSDTEVLLALFVREGEKMLSRLRGMFAFVIWDRISQKAFAARDPYGIKPLYFAFTQKGVLMGSQVKALLATTLVSKNPCHRGQAGFWLLGSVPEPYTWFRDVHSFPPGHFAWIERGTMQTPRIWWDIGDEWRSAPSVLLDKPEIAERVRSALIASVSAHLVSDVPVGVFLSGGIDSGALAGLMIDAGVKELHGVTLAFDEFAGTSDDEAPLAATIAEHYGIRHHVRRVTRAEFSADLPAIVAAMDQPSIDGINTWYASKAVAELGLKVVVSGVGGDELFQGYDSFKQLPRLVSAWSIASKIPGAMAVARWAGNLLASRTGNGRWRYIDDWLQTISGAWWLRRSVLSPAELRERLGTGLAEELMRNFSASATVHEMSGSLPKKLRLALGQIESTTYLRNQLLRDSDWASMDHSVELRTPLVDAWLIRELKPLLSAFERFPNKRLLAEAPSQPLPEALILRRKTGFGIPVRKWRQNIADKAAGHGNGDWAQTLVRAYESGVL